MTPAAILQRAQEDGVTLTLTSKGTIKATGDAVTVNRWLPVIRENKPGIVAVLQEAANDPGVAHRHWWVHLPDREPLEVVFTPEVSRAEVAALYLGARIEPLPIAPRRSATPAEAAELRELVALILRDADAAEQAQALAVALADPDAALTSFRALVADLRPDPAPDLDDRRTCEQCANLDQRRGRDGFRRCAAARRGELRITCGRDYSPVLDRPQQCIGYLPRPDDPDRRTGREPWPDLTQDAVRDESPLG